MMVYPPLFFHCHDIGTKPAIENVANTFLIALCVCVLYFVD